MQYEELSDEDYRLVNTLAEKLESVFKPPHHKLASAILTHEGNIHYGINLRTHSVRRASVCAEPGAINSVFLSNENPKVIVAIRKADVSSKAEVVNPCGLCREMATDYYPDALVIVSTPNGLKKVKTVELLPLKFTV